MWRICEITVTLDFIFRLVLYSCEDVLFNSISLNVLEGIKQFYLWFKETWLETPFKCDNVKSLVKCQIVKTWSFISLRKFRKLQHLLCLFWFLVTKQSFEKWFGLPQWSEIPRLPASLKVKRHFSTAAAFGDSAFFEMENLVRWSALVSPWQQMKLEIWCGWAHPYKTIAIFIVHSKVT